MQGKGFGGFRRLREEEKQRERKEKDEKRSRGAVESQLRIIPYIASLASLVPYATTD